MQDHDYHFLVTRVQGNVNHDAADKGRPVKIGGKASTSEPTAVGNGDRVDAYFDENGYLRVKVGGTVTVSGTVTETNSAAILTAVQLIDDVVGSEGAALGKGVLMQADDGTDLHNLQVDASGNLKVNIQAGAGSGGTASTDDAAFTAGVGSGTPMMGFATSDPVDSGDVGVVAMDTSRNLKVSIEVDNVGIGGGTQYTEADVDATITGNAVMAEGTSNTMRAIRCDDSGRMFVSIEADNVGIGGGTQYTEAATDASITGTAMMAEGTTDNLVAVRCDDDGAVHIADGGNSLTVDGTVSISGTVNVADGGGSLTVDGTVTETNSSAIKTAVEIIDDAVAVEGAALGSGVLVQGDDGTDRHNLQTNATGDLKVTLDSEVVSIQDGGNVISVDDGGSSLTVDGTVTANAGTGPFDVGGDVAHDAADSGDPVKMGAKAIALDSSPTEVATGDRTNLHANLAGVLYTIGGHPNIIRATANYTGVQTDAILHSPAAGHKFVITGIDVFVDNACTVDVGVTLEFDDTVDEKIVQHPGIAAGSGFVVGHAGGIVAIGGTAQDVLVTCEVPTGGSVSVHVTGYEEPA